MTQRIASILIAFMLCAGLLGCSGDSNALTEITIEISSDLRAPDEIDRVDIDVTNLETPEHVSADLTKRDLPRHLTLVHDGGPLGPIRITVTGYLGMLKLVERKVEMSFALRTSKSLTVRLDRECLQNFCTEETTCVKGECRPFAGDEPGGAGNGGQGGGGSGSGAGGMSAGTDAGGGGGDGGSGGAGSGSGGNAGIDSGVIDSGPPENHAPLCAISAPSDGATLTIGLNVQLAGSCDDPEDGALDASALHWSSTTDAVLGTGTALELDPLPLGEETFKLCADDPADPSLRGCAEVTVNVETPAEPDVTIISKRQGFNFVPPFVPTKSITLDSNVTGQEVTLDWRDTFLGSFETAASATISLPEVGIHTVTLIATDNIGQTGQDSDTFTVLPTGQSSLVQTLSSVSTAVGGAVRVLAIDSGSQALAYGTGSAPELQLFDASLASPTASAAISGTPLTGTITTLLIAESANLIYIGTNNGLIVCSYTKNTQIDQTTCTTYTGFTGVSDEISAIARATISGTDRLVIGTTTGLFVPTDAAVPNVGDGGLWSNEHISAVVALGNVFWFASTTSGLHYYDPTSGVSAQPGAPSLQLSALAKDAAGMLWVGSDNGIGRFDPGNVEWSLWATDSLPQPALVSNTVQALATTHVTIGGSMRDIVWVATNMGVTRFDPSVPSFMTLTNAEGLPDKNVRAIAVLPSGHKLLGTSAGVALYTGK